MILIYCKFSFIGNNYSSSNWWSGGFSYSNRKLYVLEKKKQQKSKVIGIEMLGLPERLWTILILRILEEFKIGDNFLA